MVKKRKQSFSMISSPGCSGDLKADFMYDPKTKKYYSPPSRGQTVAKLFEELLQHGTDDDRFKVMLNADRAFKALWIDLENTLTPKFSKKDLVVFPVESNAADSKYSLSSPVWICGKIVSWKKVCDWRNKSRVTYPCTREFVRCDSAEKKQTVETDAIPVEAVDKLKTANKVLLKFKKQLAEAGVKNATINFLGRAYKI
ncbi:MAG: hypothetical protein ACYTEU_11010 [Planctomycetota bacterium]|jgi:hypothetical protein